MSDNEELERKPCGKMKYKARTDGEKGTSTSGEKDRSTIREKEMSTIREKSTSTSSDEDVVGQRLTFTVHSELLEPKSKHPKRLSRSESEKFRRDRINAYIGELAKMVPYVMQTTKKIDKATVLRLTVAYLRIYHDLIKGSKRSSANSNWRPNSSMYENLGNHLLDLLELQAIFSVVL
jgi:hypothetical protein